MKPLPRGMARALSVAILAARQPKRRPLPKATATAGASTSKPRFLRVGLWLGHEKHEELLSRQEADGMGDVSLHQYLEWRLDLRPLSQVNRRADSKR